MTEIPTGSIVHSTLRMVDILPALLDLADEVNATHDVPENSPYMGAFSDDSALSWAVAQYEGIEFSDAIEYVDWVYVHLIDVINDALPLGYYVGANETDPANLGVWTYCVIGSCPNLDCDDPNHHPRLL